MKCESLTVMHVTLSTWLPLSIILFGCF